MSDAIRILVVDDDPAIALGIFGAPTFIVSNELFWGNDRLETALAWATRRQTSKR